jgi:hypothetical protein
VVAAFFSFDSNRLRTFRKRRVDFAMTALCPVHPQHQTFLRRSARRLRANSDHHVSCSRPPPIRTKTLPFSLVAVGDMAAMSEAAPSNLQLGRPRRRETGVQSGALRWRI